MEVCRSRSQGGEQGTAVVTLLRKVGIEMAQ